MRADDVNILKLLKSGDKSGMRILLQRYGRPLVIFADQFLHDLEESEDVVQELFIKFWENDLFNGICEKSLATYLFTLVRNACFNLVKRKGVFERNLPEFYDIAEQEAMELDESTIQLVHGALDKLPRRTREIVYSVICEDYSYAEAAIRYGISVNTVKTSLRKGMKQLREELGNKRGILIFLFWVRNV